MNYAMTTTAFEERAMQQAAMEGETDRMGRHLSISEPDPSGLCVDGCGKPGIRTLAVAQLAQSVDEMEQQKTLKICRECERERCLANIEGRVAMIREAMLLDNDIEIARSATEGANWFAAIEETLE